MVTSMVRKSESNFSNYEDKSFAHFLGVKVERRNCPPRNSLSSNSFGNERYVELRIVKRKRKVRIGNVRL